MIDLHTHSLLSDGALVPAELVRRAIGEGLRRYSHNRPRGQLQPGLHRPQGRARGRGALGPMPIVGHTRHRDNARPAVRHSGPGEAGEGTGRKAGRGARRDAGRAGDARHEPGRHNVRRGHTLAPRADQQARTRALAAKKGVYLEISARKGHSLSNGHVAAMATETGARLVINTDAHEPGRPDNA